MRLTPEQRFLIGNAVDRGVNKFLVAKVFGVTRKTVYKWIKRRKQLKDRKRRAKKKITLNAELSILSIRNMFNWGTARIQQALQSLPGFMKKIFINPIVQGFKVSRTAINDILRKHRLNGYQNTIKTWKFFRAKEPNELWQLDIKGPFIVQGKKYWMIVCIDDYSRYLLIAECFDHCPTTNEITGLLDKLSNKPKKLLTDNARHFAEQWKSWCRWNGIEPLFAHPYYPQDKGKVERAIRNIAEEFVNLLKKFPGWLLDIKDYIKWFNEKRFHRGINSVPKELFT